MDNWKEQLKKVWGQMDRRSIMTIIVVGAIALGYIFPTAPKSADTSGLSQGLVSANQSINSMAQQITNLSSKITSVEGRLVTQEAKPGAAELQAAIASAQGATAKVALLETEINELRQQIVSGGGSVDLTTITAILSRLDIAEAEIDDLQAGGGSSSSYDYSITASFNTADCQWHSVYGTTRYGQQFTMGSYDMEVTAVRLYLRRGGTATNAIITMYNLGTNGLPSGTAVWTTTVDTSSWSTTGYWISLPVTGVTLNSGSDYGVTIAAPSGNQNSNIQFGYHPSGSYSEGGLLGSLTGGQSWTVSPGPDMGFEIRGLRY